MKNYLFPFFMFLFASCVGSSSSGAGRDITMVSPTSIEQDTSLVTYEFHSLSEEDYRHIFDVMSGEVGDDRFPEIYRPIDYEVVFSREHLLVYPNSIDIEDVKWKLAFADANNSVGDDQADMGIVEEFIAEMLSQGMGITEVVASLEENRIYVNDFESIKNIAGLGQDGYVILLSIPSHYYPVAAFAVYPQDSKFFVEKIFGWEISTFPSMGKYFDLQVIGDTNENEISEIIIQVEEGHSGIPGAESLDIYYIEWSGNKFGFKSKKFPVFFQSCDEPCEGKWEFLEMNNTKALLINNYWNTRNGCPTLQTESIYLWDGEEYTQEAPRIILPEKNTSQECQIAWAEAVIALYEKDRINKFPVGWRDDFAISVFETSLHNWTIKNDQIWGIAGRDFLKLKLGIWYELRGDEQKAKIILGDLASTPYLPEYDLASKLALQYLETREEFGSTLACIKVNELWAMELKKLPPGTFTLYDDEEMLEHFGTVDWKGGLCNASEMFSTELTSAKLDSFEKLEVWLKAKGIIIRQQDSIDINGDKFEDHVIWLDADVNLHFDYWVLFGSSDGYIASPLTYSIDKQKTPFEIVEILVDADTKVFMLKTNTEITIFSPSSYDLIVLMEEFDVELVKILSDISPARLLINIDGTWQGRMTKNYQWDTNEKKFTLMPDIFEITQYELEEKLFVERDFQSVIEYVDEFLLTAPPEPKYPAFCGVDVPDGCKYLPEWYVPYFRYMKGIAYEKMNKLENAEMAYLELWQEFPDNIFGIVSGMKLSVGDR